MAPDVAQASAESELKISDLILASISGCLLILAFPKFSWSFIAWFALIPLLIAIYRSSFKGALICGLVAGVFFFGGLLYWIFLFGLLAGFGLILSQSFFFLFFGLGAKVIHSYFKRGARLILVPALWVSLEFFRSIGPWGFSWGVLGYSQYNFLPIIQIARWTGVLGVSFLLVFVNEFIAESYTHIFQQKGPATQRIVLRIKGSGIIFLRDTVLVLLGVILLVGIGNLDLSGSRGSGETIKIAILQPSIPQDIKWEPMKKEDVFEAHLKLAQEAAEEKPYIIIWPETSVPAYLLEEEEYFKRIKALAEKADSFLLVGGLYRPTDRHGEDKGRSFNSAFLFSPKGEILDRYDKLHLVPFGEYVPLKPIFSNIKAVASASGDTSPGKEFTVFETGAGRFSAVICFESSDPFISRRLALKGAEMLVVMTNDGWFNKTAAAEQHLSMAVLRAVENDFFVVQAANTGVSAIIDSRGRVVSRTALFDRKYLAGEVVLRGGMSFYKRFGNLFSCCCVLISFGCFLFIRFFGHLF